MATKAKKSAKPAVSNSPGTLVLQWLTYAFWGLTVVSVAWLTFLSIGHFIQVQDTGSSRVESTIIAYSLAAAVVLFLISLICDFIYTRFEPLAKRGGATVIMIIHAVLYALCGIGFLIASVFAVVTLLIGDGGVGSKTTLVSGLIVAIVFAATLVRVLRPGRTPRTPQLYWAFMTLVTGAAVVAGAMGPAYSASQTRTDRLIERNLSLVSDAIATHTQTNKTLPESFSDIDTAQLGDAKRLLDEELVVYRPGVAVAATEVGGTSGVSLAENPVYRYELCVTYKESSEQTSYYGPREADYTNTSPNTYTHPAGEVCYKLVTDYIPAQL